MRVLGVEGRTIRIKGLDMLDGTPVLDIKLVLKKLSCRGQKFGSIVIAFPLREAYIEFIYGHIAKLPILA